MCKQLAVCDVDIVYHYCPLESFVSIIKNKELWLTRTDFTNDKYEMNYIDQQILEIAQELVDEGKISEKAYTDIKKNYERITRVMFMTCFSKYGKNLNQWRLYAKDATGVSVGFSTAKLTEFYEIKPSLTVLNPGYAFYKVKYIDDEMKNEMKSEIISNANADGYNVTVKDFIWYAKNYYMKAAEFKNEEEYRILYNPEQKQDFELGFDIDDDFYKQDKLDFRIQNSRLIPYFKMSFKEELIREVIIGPKCEAGEAEIRKFLMKYGFNDVFVIKSELPYR